MFGAKHTLCLTANNNLPNKLAVMHDRFNDYNLGNTTLVLIYNKKKTKLKTQYQFFSQKKKKIVSIIKIFIKKYQ